MYIYRVCRNVGVPCYLHNFCVDMCAKLTWFGKVDKAISALYKITVNAVSCLTRFRCRRLQFDRLLHVQVGKTKKLKEEKQKEEGVGMNIKSIVVVALLMVLMLFAVHCTWVTSNAYSSPSIVLASYGHDG